MAELSRETQIRLLESLGVNVQVRKGRVHYLESIDEDSPVLADAASFVYEVMEKHAALEGLVRRRLRTQEEAIDEMASRLRITKDNIQRWQREHRGDSEIEYVAKTLQEALGAKLDSLPVREARIYRNY
jgi:hypothetical protein